MSQGMTRREFIQKGLTIVAMGATAPSFLTRTALAMNNPFDLAQVTSRLWRSLRPPRVNDAPAPPLRRWHAHPVPFVLKQPAYVDPTHVRFLNVAGSIATNDCWNDPSSQHLWLYHLHYFDDLGAAGAQQRDAWQRALLERWMRENAPALGVGWEPFPTSVRIVNIIKWLVLGNVPPAGLLHNLAMQVRHLGGTLEFHLRGNHLLVNAKALVFAGLFFDGPEADAWVTRGLAILDTELPEQILVDGGHFERSPMYHAFMLEDVLDLYNIGRCVERLPGAMLEQLRHRVGAMRHWLAAMIHPDGDVAFFNDTALGEAPTRAQLEQYARALDLGAAGRPASGVTHLAESGFIRVQTDRAVLIADVGEIGPAYLPGHAHADTLSFEVSLDGQRLVVNSGTSTYAPGPQRDFERSTRAHSCVEVDGVSSSETWGSFRVARRAQPVDLRIEDTVAAGSRVYAFRCSHTGYLRLPGRVTHTRSWLLDDDSLRITDQLEGKFDRATSRFYCHPDWTARLPLLTRGAHCVRVQADVAAHIQPAAYHPRFGISLPASCVVLSGSASTLTTTFSWRDHEDPVLL